MVYASAHKVLWVALVETPPTDNETSPLFSSARTLDLFLTPIAGDVI
jgi:hypothetical protein